MNYTEIMQAIETGFLVHWKSDIYQVSDDLKSVVCNLNGTCHGLLYKGKLQGFEKDFYVQLNSKHLDIVVNSFLYTALWCEGLENDFDHFAFSESNRQEVSKLVQDFYKKVEFKHLGGLTDFEQVGHDLLLTLNGHGTGFWDREDLKHGEEITKVVDSLNKCTHTFYQDNKIFIEL